MFTNEKKTANFIFLVLLMFVLMTIHKNHLNLIYSYVYNVKKRN